MKDQGHRRESPCSSERASSQRRALARALGAVVFGLVACAAVGSAQADLAQRCRDDLLSAAEAAARTNRARRCALIFRIGNPNAWIPVAGGLKEYVEYDSALNPTAQNSYFGSSYTFQINKAAVELLYFAGAIAQSNDELRYFRWDRDASLARTQPRYPTYGSHPSVAHSSNRQLFPHPTNLDDCFFYLDKAGTLPAAGYAFHVNGFCDAAPPSGCAACHPAGLSTNEPRKISSELAVAAGCTFEPFEQSFSAEPVQQTP